MLIGEVIGNVWATKKYDGLDGLKFLIVKTEDNKRMVANMSHNRNNGGSCL